MNLEPPRLDVPKYSNESKLWEDNLQGNILVFGEEVVINGSRATTYNVTADCGESLLQILREDKDPAVVPDEYYDYIIINKALEELETKEGFEFLNRCTDLLKNKGKLISISRACYDAHQIYTLLEEYDIDLENFVKYRLSNKNIVELRPTEIAFSEYGRNIKNRKVLVSYINESKDIPVTGVSLEHMWKAFSDYPITRVLVKLTWLKNSSKS